MRRLKEVSEEYGIEVEYVDEENTSKTCPICRAIDNHKRIPGGYSNAMSTTKYLTQT